MALLARRGPPDFVFVPAEEADELRALAAATPTVPQIRGALDFQHVTRRLPPDFEPVEHVRVPRWLVEARGGTMLEET